MCQNMGIFDFIQGTSMQVVHLFLYCTNVSQSIAQVLTKFTYLNSKATSNYQLLIYWKNVLQHKLLTAVNLSGPGIFAQDTSSEIH